MAEYYKLLSPMIDPCHARWINYRDLYTGNDLMGVCMAAYGKQSSASATSCAGGTAGYGSGTPADPSYWLVPNLIGVACVDMSLIADDASLRAQPTWGAFEARVNAERSICPRHNLSAGQLETLRYNAGGSAAQCGGIGVNPTIQSAPSYGSSGTARACTASHPAYSSSGGFSSSNGGLGAGIGAAVFFVFFAGAVFYWFRQQQAKRGQERKERQHGGGQMTASAEPRPSIPTVINVTVNAPHPQLQPMPYGAQPMPYGAQPMPYGAQPMPYGAQPMPYGAQPMPYGAQPMPMGCVPAQPVPMGCAVPMGSAPGYPPQGGPVVYAQPAPM